MPRAKPLPDLLARPDATVLSLRGMGLTALPAELFQLKSLCNLDLSANPLTDLPPELAQLTRLTDLRLDSVPVKRLPRVLPRLPLQGLSLSGLADLDFADAFQQLAALPRLASLRLNENPFSKGVPRELFELRSLERLWLVGCELPSLPPEIARLEKLELLGIGDNRIAKLPDELERMPALKQLAIQGSPCFTKERARVQRLRARGVMVF